MCCDAPDPPDMAPVAAASDKAAELARATAAEDLAFRKDVYNQNAPRVQALYDLATRVAQQQLGIADENQQFARQQQQFYTKSFMPNEMQTIADSYGASYLGDTDRAQLNSLVAGEGDMSAGARMSAMQALGLKAENAAAERASTRASADINSSFGQAYRGLTRLGGDPNRLAAAAAQLANQQALAKVGASNQAREAARGQMLGLRTGVANFGRNMPNTAGQAFGLATQAGSSATGNAGAAANANLPSAQFQAGAYGTQLGAAGLMQQGALGYGGLLNNMYGNQINAYGNQLEMIGTLAGAGITKFSDRRLKSDIVLVGKHPKGFNVYEYTIAGRRERGVMADEVEKVLPHAVSTHPSGYKLVNYGAL